jgi:hypothetical protein
MVFQHSHISPHITLIFFYNHEIIINHKDIPQLGFVHTDIGGVNLKSCTHTLMSLCIFLGIFKGNIPFSLDVASKNQFKHISKVIRCAKMYVQYIGRLEAPIELDCYIFSYSSFGKLVCVFLCGPLKKALACFMYFFFMLPSNNCLTQQSSQNVK